MTLRSSVTRIVLDLDETLIKCGILPTISPQESRGLREIRFVVRGSVLTAHVRPYFSEFLEFIMANFDEIYVYTAASAEYAYGVVEALFPAGSVADIWTNEDCLFSVRDDTRMTNDEPNQFNHAQLMFMDYDVIHRIAIGSNIEIPPGCDKNRLVQLILGGKKSVTIGGLGITAVFKNLGDKKSKSGKIIDSPYTLMVDDRNTVSWKNTYVCGDRHINVMPFFGHNTDTVLRDIIGTLRDFLGKRIIYFTSPGESS